MFARRVYPEHEEREEKREREGQHEYSTAPRDASSVSREEKRVQKRLVADDDAMIASFSRLSASSKKSDATRERTSIANDAIASSMDFFSTRSAAAASPSPVVLFVADIIYHTVRRQSRSFLCQVFLSFQNRSQKILRFKGVGFRVCAKFKKKMGEKLERKTHVSYRIELPYAQPTTTTTTRMMEHSLAELLAETRNVLRDSECATYRTLSRKFSLTPNAGKRLLWTIVNEDGFERKDWKCVYAMTNGKEVRLRCANAEETNDGSFKDWDGEVAVYALVKKKEEGDDDFLEQLVRAEEKETKAVLDSEKDCSWTLIKGAFEKSTLAKRLPRGKKFMRASTTTTTTTEQKKPAGAAAAKKPGAAGPKSGNIASMFGGTGKKAVAKPKEPVAKKKETPKKKTPVKKKPPVVTNADAMIEDEEGDSDSDDLGGGGRRNRRLSGGKRAFVDDEEEEEEEEEPVTTPVKKMKTSDEDNEPPSPEIIDKQPEEEETPRRRSTRSTPSKATPTPKSNSKKGKPLSKKAQKDIIKARKARMQKKVIEEMDDETGEEMMRTIFVDPETGEECNEDGTLKAK